MSHQRLALAGILALSACKSPDATPVADHAAAAELQALLDQAVTAGLPGISAAVANSTGVVWTGVAGQADLEAGTPVRADMLFGVGSITKTFAAVVVLQLAEEGRLDLNATAASLLGAAVDGIPNADQATIAQLLNHTGGVPSWEDDSAWIHEGRGDRLDPTRIWGKTATLTYIRGHQPLAPPGKAFSYANTNFTLLGMVIEKVTGADAGDEIHRRILVPLGLADIHLEGFEPVPEARVAHRYHWATPTFRHDAGINPAFPEIRPGLIDASRSNLSVEWTAGGMVATARDLARYAVALRDGRLLKPESMKFLTEWFPAGTGDHRPQRGWARLHRIVLLGGGRRRSGRGGVERGIDARDQCRHRVRRRGAGARDRLPGRTAAALHRAGDEGRRRPVGIDASRLPLEPRWPGSTVQPAGEPGKSTRKVISVLRAWGAQPSWLHRSGPRPHGSAPSGPARRSPRPRGCRWLVARFHRGSS